MAAANYDELRETLLALQVDLDVDASLGVARSLAKSWTLGKASGPTAQQLAQQLMLAMRTANGGEICWPRHKPGSRYPPIVKATRVLLEMIM